ncbi:baseplate J/gp47 family protein [Endozoicomonas ascidiicola]|uniref:baseplate J/gp47 family protein n=1 Tax=Endozoicomonas ascidiicola TaxID=1698521 RepID=UPI00082FE205|nr:baseplate J/gp47 family protein [Endozoicomonas ascidiicola]
MNHKEDFTQIVKDAGIPTTEAEMQQQWNQINTDQGSLIKNDNKYSSFWKLVSALVTTPALWVVQFLINNLLPNSFIKTAAGKFLDILAWALGLERKAAVFTQGMITFTRDQVGNVLVVPSGTVIQTPQINGVVYSLVTLADTQFPDNAVTVDIECRATGSGIAYNLAPGYFSILPEPIGGVVSVRNNDDWITVSGADAETDEELRLRCRNQFTAVGQFHHDAAYKAIISEFAGLRIDYICFEHGAPRGPGSANTYLMIDSGAPDQPFVDAVNTHIRDNGYHGHGDDMECFPMPEVINNLNPHAYLNPNLSPEQQAMVMTGIENMIRCAFRENQAFTVTKTWPFTRFSFSKLGEELHGQFPDLISIEFNQEDIVTQMELPVIGQLNMVKHLGVEAT